MSGKLPIECFEMASSGVKICSSNPDTQAELLNAYRKKDLEGFKVAANKEDCDPNFLYSNNDYMRILDTAAQDGYAEYVKIIIDAGADVNSINPTRSRAPIHFAVECGHLDVLKILTEKEADVNIRDSNGSTPLHYLAKQKWKPGEVMYEQCLEFLLNLENLELNITNRKGLTAVHLGVIEGAYEAIKMLLEKGSRLDLDSAKVGFKKTTARDEILKKYPELKDDLPPVVGPDEAYKIKMDSDKLFQLLYNNEEERFCQKFKEQIKDKAEKYLLTCTDGKQTFLQYCCCNGYEKAVDALLNAEADVNYFPAGSSSCSILTCQSGHPDILRKLLEKNPDLSPDQNGENPLHVVVKYIKNSPGHVECFEILLRRMKEGKVNLDINAQDVKGNAPLHYAVKYGDEKCVNDLLMSGAYIGTQNKFKDPPLAHMNSLMLGKFLDNCVTTNAEETDRVDAENRAVVFNYSFLSKSKKSRKSSERDEVKVLLTDEKETGVKEKQEPVLESLPLLYMSQSQNLKHLLLHPVLTSFIMLKWQRIRIFYYVNLLFYSLFCLLLTTYILFGYRSIQLDDGAVSDSSPPVLAKAYHNKGSEAADEKIAELKPPSENLPRGFISTTAASIPESPPDVDESAVIIIVRVLLIIFIIVLICREVFQVVVNFEKYFKDLENWLEILLIFVAAVVVIKDCSREFSTHNRLATWCPQFCALAILLSWCELVLLIGKHPGQSLHIEMFKTVSVNFLKFLAWYAILILAFALTFYTLFRGCNKECSEGNAFYNPGSSIFKTVIMLTGELEAGESIPFFTFIGTSHLIFILFVFLITIVLINLLNGLAVDDTQTIRSDSFLFRCISLVKLISYIEKMLLTSGFKPPRSSCIQGPPEENKTKSQYDIFDYFAKKIVFFPDLLPDKKVYVLPNQKYRIAFSDPKIYKNVSDSSAPVYCWSTLTDYYLDPFAAKSAEQILADKEAKKNDPSDLIEKLSTDLGTCNKKIEDLEKKLEDIESSNKQIFDTVIRLWSSISVNYADNDDR